MAKSKIKRIAGPYMLRALKASPFIRHKLQYFITVNELYIKADVKTSQDKDRQRHTRIADSLLACYKTFRDEYDDKILEIELVKTATNKLDRGLLDYEDSLRSLFNAPVIKVENMQNAVRYRLRLKESSEQYTHVLSDNKEQLKKGYIKLSKYDTWNYEKEPHGAISGPTGSGKSRLAYFIINQAMQETSDSNIFIIDPKRDELAAYSRDIFKLSNIYKDKKDILDIMRHLAITMNRRYEVREKNGVIMHGKMTTFPPIFVFFDELSEFQTTLSTKKDKGGVSDRQEFSDLLTQLILKGRASNIHFLLITQQLNANAVPTEIRESLSLKVALGDISAENYKMNFGETKDKSQILTNIPTGAGYIKNGTKPVQPFQSFMIYTPFE